MPLDNHLEKVASGIPGTRRDHRRRPAARAAHAHLRRRGLRQDAVRHGVPGARRHRVRRAGRLHGLRGDRRGTRRERRLAGLRPEEARGAEEAGHRLRARRAQRDRGDRRVRPRRPLRPPPARHRDRRRQARGARHDRVAVLPACPTRPCCAPNCGGCSAGSRTAG